MISTPPLPLTLVKAATCSRSLAVDSAIPSVSSPALSSSTLAPRRRRARTFNAEPASLALRVTSAIVVSIAIVWSMLLPPALKALALLVRPSERSVAVTANRFDTSFSLSATLSASEISRSAKPLTAEISTLAASSAPEKSAAPANIVAI